MKGDNGDVNGKYLDKQFELFKIGWKHTILGKTVPEHELVSDGVNNHGPGGGGMAFALSKLTLTFGIMLFGKCRVSPADLPSSASEQDDESTDDDETMS